MKIVNFYCDACGKIMHEYHTIEDLDGGDMQFCPECWPAIVKAVRHLAAGMMASQPEQELPFGIREDEIPEVEPVDEETPEAPKISKRGAVDKAKAQALRNAGWTLQQIADELHCHPGYISKVTVPAETKARKPLEWEGTE